MEKESVDEKADERMILASGIILAGICPGRFCYYHPDHIFTPAVIECCCLEFVFDYGDML